MTAARGLTIQRMTELGGVSRSSFYRFDSSEHQQPQKDDPDDMEVRDVIHRIAQTVPIFEISIGWGLLIGIAYALFCCFN